VPSTCWAEAGSRTGVALRHTPSLHTPIAAALVAVSMVKTRTP
jgi:hypothetical protein